MTEPSKNMMQVRCPCGHTMPVSRQFLGGPVTCYACGETFTVAAPSAGSTSVPSNVPPEPPASPPAPATPASSPPAPVPPQVVYVVQGPQVLRDIDAVERSSHPAAPRTMHVTHGSPVPSAERTIWEGRPALAYHLPGMLWTIAWLAFWLAVAANGSRLLAWIQTEAHAALPDAGEIVPPPWINSWYLTLFVLAIAAWAALRLSGRIMAYFNAYYCFTTQRIRLRQGVLDRALHQMELYRVKDFAIVEPFWGRVFNYAHVRIVSSDRLAHDVILVAVPGGAAMMEKIREAAQWSRSETGVTTIHE
jgi:hypothetical protein